MKAAQRPRVLPAARPNLDPEAQRLLTEAHADASRLRTDHRAAALAQLGTWQGQGFEVLTGALRETGLAATTHEICKAMRGIARGGGEGPGSPHGDDDASAAAALLGRLRRDGSAQHRDDMGLIELTLVAVQRGRPGIACEALRLALTLAPTSKPTAFGSTWPSPRTSRISPPQPVHIDPHPLL